MIYLAYMDTEHFEFHAFGTSEDDAREMMAKTFAEHLRRYAPDGDEPFAWWSEGGQEEPTADKLHDYYGIRVIEAKVGEGYCDAEPMRMELTRGNLPDVEAFGRAMGNLTDGEEQR